MLTKRSSKQRFSRSDGMDADQVLEYVVEYHPELKELRCEDIGFSDEHMQEMNRLFVNYHSAIHLSSLELPNNVLTSAACRSLASILDAQHETLSKLDLSRNPITGTGLGDLFEPLIIEYPLSNLLVLDLRETQLGGGSGRGAAAIATLLRNNSRLQELYLGHNNLGTKGAKAIALELASNSSLQVLDISYNNIKSRGASLLAQALDVSSGVGNSKLRILDVTCNKIGLGGLRAFCDLLLHDHKLEGFFCGCNGFGPEGAAYLAAVLKHNYTLRDLRLADNNIGDDGTKWIAGELAENNMRSTTLEFLDLGWNGIGCHGANSLAQALKENAKLAHINLEGNQICSNGAVALAESLGYSLSLNELILKSNKIDNLGAFALAMALGKPSCHLEKVNWQENPIAEDGIKALERIPQLRRNHQYWLGQLIRDLSKGVVSGIDLPGFRRMGDEEILLLTEVLASTCPLIRSFRLCGRMLSSRSLVPMAQQIIPSPSRISRLYLTNCQCGEEIAAALETSLSHNQSLEVLSLTNCHIGSTGATAITNGLSNHESLRRLNLDRNEIGDDGLVTLGSLSSLSSLESLSVCNNSITDRSISSLGQLLQQLAELHLSSNSITNHGAFEFCRLLVDHSSGDSCRLKELSLSQNQLSEKCAQMIKNLLPDNAYMQY